MNHNFHYNYIICGSDGYYLIGYSDIINLENVCYYKRYWDHLSLFSKLLVRTTFSKFINRYIKQPFSSLSYRLVLNAKFKNEAPICLIVFAPNSFLLNTPYLQYFDKKYPGNKKVLYYQDKVQVHTPGVDMNRMKGIYDIIYSYNRADCEQYGLKYYPTPYSRLPIPSDSSLEDTDVFYCGRAKTRYNVIVNAYSELSKQGLKCDFYLNSAPEECPRIDGIHYDVKLTYKEYLQHLSYSKALLEVMQEDADGFTPRLWESIMYDKHLITNNQYIKDSGYYNSRYMHDLRKSISEASSFVKEPVLYSEMEKERLNPVHFLYDIEKTLE